MGGILAGFQPDRFFITKDGSFELDRLRSQIVDREEPVILFGTALAFLHFLERQRTTISNCLWAAWPWRRAGAKAAARRWIKGIFLPQPVSPSWDSNRFSLERIRNEPELIRNFLAECRPITPAPVDEISNY